MKLSNPADQINEPTDTSMRWSPNWDVGSITTNRCPSGLNAASSASRGSAASATSEAAQSSRPLETSKSRCPLKYRVPSTLNSLGAVTCSPANSRTTTLESRSTIASGAAPVASPTRSCRLLGTNRTVVFSEIATSSTNVTDGGIAPSGDGATEVVGAVVVVVVSGVGWVVPGPGVLPTSG